MQNRYHEVEPCVRSDNIALFLIFEFSNEHLLLGVFPPRLEPIGRIAS